MVERRKQIEIEEQEIKRKEKELIATVKFIPAGKVELVAEKKCVPAEMLGHLDSQDWEEKVCDCRKVY